MADIIIRTIPDFKGIEDIDTKINKLKENADVSIKAAIDAADATKEVESIKSKLKSMELVKSKINVDTEGALIKVETLKNELGEVATIMQNLNKGTASINFSQDIDKLKNQFKKDIYKTDTSEYLKSHDAYVAKRALWIERKSNSMQQFESDYIKAEKEIYEKELEQWEQYEKERQEIDDKLVQKRERKIIDEQKLIAERTKYLNKVHAQALKENELYDKMNNVLGEGTSKLSESFTGSFANGAEEAKQFISTLTGVDSAAIKATGSMESYGRSFQTFAVQEEQADGSVRSYTVAINQATGDTYKLNKGIIETGKTIADIERTIGKEVGTFAGSFANGAKEAKQFISALTGVDSAAIKATGSMESYGRTFQTFSAERIMDDGSVQTLRYAIETSENGTQKIYELNQGFKEIGKSAETAANKVRSFGELIMSTIKSMAASTLVRGMITSFKDALSIMKEVDDELVVIRKVTGRTNEELYGVRQSAYATASKYGVSASDYLSSAASFARAGYDYLSESLAELSIKTQIVGDTDADTADQFLLSMDAAYGYKGSVEELTKVLDGANEIDNNYATSIEKIAEGLGLVAPIASQVHVTEAELTAAIGTITAKTQRTGTEAARALRALLLNIIGDTTTEIEDGVTVTTEEINGLRDILKLYAADAVAAAEATGEVIDPMEAIKGLAKSMDEGLVTEQKLMQLITDVGGKLRSSQLMALVQGMSQYDGMYQSMINDYKNAIGSADDEVENAMDSWTRKVQVLKNTWAEFIQKTIDTGTIKGFIDGLNDLIKVFDNLANTIGVVGGLTIFAKAHTIIEKATSALARYRLGAGATKKEINALTKSWSGLSSAAASMLGKIGLIITAISVLNTAIKGAKSERIEILDARINNGKEAQRTIEDLTELYNDYQEITVENGYSQEEATEATNALTDALKRQGIEVDITKDKLDELTKKVIEEKEEEIQAALVAARLKLIDARNNWSIWGLLGIDTGFKNSFFVEMIENWDALLNPQKNADKILDYYDSLIEKEKELRKSGKENTREYEVVSERIHEISDEAETYRSLLELANGETENSSDSLSSLSDGIETASEKYDTLASSVQKATEAIQKYKDAIEEEKGDAYKEYAGIYNDVMEEYKAGRYGSDKYVTGISTLLGDDLLNELLGNGETFQSIGEALGQEFWKGVFINGGDDYGADFAYKMFDKYADESGDVVDGNGEIVASFEETDNGLSVIVDDFQKLSEFLSGDTGVSIGAEALSAWMQALGIYNPNLEITTSEIQNLAKAAGALSESGEKVTTSSLLEYISKLKDDEGNYLYEVQDAWNLINTIIDNSDIELTVDDKGKISEFIEQIFEGRDGADGIEKSLEEAAKVKFQNVTEQLSSYGYGNTNAVQTYSNEEGTVAMNFTPVLPDGTVMSPQAFEEYCKHVINGGTDYLNLQIGAEFTGEDAVKEAEEAAEAASKLEGYYYANIIAQVYGLDKIDDLAWQLDTLPNKKDVEINVISNLGAGNVLDKIGGLAVGTDSAKGGLALVNEEGAEIIQNGSSAWIAGGGEPVITNVPSGAKVWTAEETADIFKRSGVSGLLEGIQAFGDGVGGQASGIKRYTTTSSGDMGSTEDASEEEKDRLETLKDIVSLRKSELSLVQAQNGSVKDQIAKYHKIQNAIKSQIRYMEEIGADQTEINNMYTEWYKINNKIKDLQKEIYDSLEKSVNSQIEKIEEKSQKRIDKWQAKIDAIKKAEEEEEKELELQEKTLAVEKARDALAKAKEERNVRIFNSKTGQWEWTYNRETVASARESYDTAKKELSDYNKEQNRNANIEGYEKKIADEQAATKEKTAQWQKILTALEDPVKSISKSLQIIADNATKDELSTIKKLNEALEPLGYKIDTSTIKKKKGTKTFDKGGVLNGLGGIKATSEDEMVIPPEVTKAMLKPNATATFLNRMSELGYLYGASPTVGMNAVNNSIGNQYNGGQYTFGNITLNEQQAKSMTVMDLVRASRGLRAYNAV